MISGKVATTEGSLSVGALGTAIALTVCPDRGTCVSPTGVVKKDEPVLDFTLTMPNGEKISRTLNGGELNVIPLAIGEVAKIHVKPKWGFDMGNGDGKIVGAASQNAIDNDIKINEIIKTAAGVLGGGGGGRLTLAQGAGKNADKMDEAIKTAVDLIKG